MKPLRPHLPSLALAVSLGCTVVLLAQTPDRPPARESGSPPGGGAFPPPDADPGFDRPPPFGPGGFGEPGGPGFGGPGGTMGQERKLVKQFDKDGDGRLNNDERKAARQFIAEQGDGRGPRGFRGGPPGGFGGPGENQTPPAPGRKLTPTDVPSFPNAPLYDPKTLRILFLEFENADWEKELAHFNNTDVEVPARLTVDGKTYPDVGVHFRGNTSLMMVSEGRKRPLNLSLDFVHRDQQFAGYRTLNLLNSHEDPSFLRTVLYSHIARDYIPTPKANFVHLVINSESWGIYVNAQQVNKDFVKDWWDPTKGARWKVPGNPGGRGGLNYLGEDPSAYQRTYEIKSKDDPKSWAALFHLCKVLNQTPPDQLESALGPLLDIDGTLKYLALDNVLANNDGFWTRASDYYLYLDETGRFHLIPNDTNESFSEGGGPMGPGGRGMPGGFGPGMLVAPRWLEQGDRNNDQKLTQDEFIALAGAWFDKLDADRAGKVSAEQFADRLGEVLPPPQGFGPPGGGAPGPGQMPGRGRAGFGPTPFLASSLFSALDADKDGSLTREELSGTFSKWFARWDTAKGGAIDEDALRNGLNAALPQLEFAGRGGPGGRGGPRGGGGPGMGGGPRTAGAELDPLVALNDTSKPLLSRLLAVPALRTRYLVYVRDIAEKWLDWNRLGPIAQQYQALIAEEVKLDTRKIYSSEAFFQGIAGDTPSQPNVAGPGSWQRSSLKSFAERRRAFLLNHAEVKKASL